MNTNVVLNALYAAHAVMREGIHDDNRYRLEVIRQVEDAIKELGGEPPEVPDVKQ